jgi:Protein of unknown function (DUF3306)
MADGILGRWSQRKQAVREGKPLEEPVRVMPAPVAAASVDSPMTTSAANAATTGQIDPASAPAQTPSPPTLEDVQALTPESDFSAFTGVNVSPEVSNAAMKKLFTDPHYNVMDGLDIYIDDYSKPDPMPLSMLRKLASAQFLNLFDDEKDAKEGATVTHNPAASAKSEEDTAIAHVKPEDHAHPDLRLQPNDAPGAQDPGRGTQ